VQFEFFQIVVFINYILKKFKLRVLEPLNQTDTKSNVLSIQELHWAYW
jgi:hypothetical protein